MKSLAALCAETLTLPPTRPAIEYGGRWYDWGEIHAFVATFRLFLAKSGTGAVVFVPRNRPSALAALLALLLDERTVRMVYAFQSPTAIAASVARLDAAVMVMAEEDFTSEILTLMATRGMAGIALSELQVHAITNTWRLVPRPARTAGPTVDILTSGTTGPPKHFPIPHRVIAGFVANQGMSLIDDPAEPPFLMSFPIGNISGVYGIAASLLRGKRVVLLDRFSVEKWVDFVKTYRPVASGAPPAAVAMILDAAVPPADLASLRTFSTGAAPLDPSVQRRFEQHYGISILLSYGATEFGGPVAAMTPALHALFGTAKLGSVGRAMAGVRLRIRDAETGAILAPGGEGLLEVVSPRLGPEWIATSDMALIDKDDFLYLRGRADGAIMRGGFKLLPETIERALLLHPGISAAGVVALADARLGQVPGAAVVLRPDTEPVDIETLSTHLRAHLPATHLPAQWRFVAVLPKNASFKVDRSALRALFDTEG